MYEQDTTSVEHHDVVDRPKVQIRTEVIGNRGSGKTSLLWRFVRNELFTGNSDSILEAHYAKELDINDTIV